MFETGSRVKLGLHSVDVPPCGAGGVISIAGGMPCGYGSDIKETGDLQLSQCRLMTAMKKGIEPLCDCLIRVATKYVNVARRH